MAPDLPATLLDFITERLETLSCQKDEGTADFVEGIVNEDSFELEDKLNAIVGMLEIEEGDQVMEEAIRKLLEDAEVFKESLLAKEREERERELESKKAAELDGAGKGKKVLTPEEELARKAALLKLYGFQEEEDEKERLAKAEADKVPTAVFVDPKLLTKKGRKKAQEGVDILMQPNLNSAIVKGNEIQRRQEDAAQAAIRKNRDAAALKKQKEMAAKSAADKKQKAQKVERRA